MKRRLVTSLADKSAFIWSGISWDIDWRAQSAGVTTSGRRNIAIGELPRWVGSIQFVNVREKVAAWNAMRMSGRGPAAVYRVHMGDKVTDGYSKGAPVSFSGNVFFADGAGFLANAVVPLVGDVAAGASEIVVDETGISTPIQVGQVMSCRDWPFCVIARRGSGSSVTLTVEMPIRKAMLDGDLLRLRGAGLFELVDPAQGAQSYGATLVARPELRLQEWLYR